MVFPLRTLLFSFGIILFVFLFWALFRQKNEQASSAGYSESSLGSLPDNLIVLLFFAGFVLFPIHFRGPLLNGAVGYLGYINLPCTLAVLLSFWRFRNWTKADLFFFAAWLLLFVVARYSNQVLSRPRALVSAFQSVLPLFIVLYRMNQSTRKKALSLFLLLFDVFVIALLICGIEEKLFGKHNLLILFRDWMAGMGLNTGEYNLYASDSRFSSIWGHPLTTAVIFNSFFALNGVYFRSYGRRFPVPVFFIPSLIGVLLASSKTGITVCFLLFIVMAWKYKKWFLFIIPVLGLMYFTGAFNHIIRRFTKGSLTTGRLENLAAYFSSGLGPLRLLSGNGSGTIFSSSSPAYPYRAGFEFPLLMFAHDYGILFSLLHVVGLFGYSTWRFLRRKEWFAWICFTLLFAEINTYNAYALRNQDVCFFFCFVAMVLLNMIKEDSTADLSC